MNIFIFIFKGYTRSSKMNFFSCIKVLERININSQKYPRKEEWRRRDNPTKYYTINNIKSRNLIYDKGSIFINGGKDFKNGVETNMVNYMEENKIESMFHVAHKDKL